MLEITNSNITIMVGDMSKSLSFYSLVLGFKVLQQYGNHYAQISAPGVVIGLHLSSGKSNISENVSIGFIVTDFSNAKKHLEELNVEHLERNEEGGRFLHFKDPDGTPLYIIDPKR